MKNFIKTQKKIKIMTTKDFNKRYKVLVKESNIFLLEYAQQALKSGAIDIKSENGDWGLPKDVLVATLETLKNEHKPHQPRGKSAKRIRNIYHCV